MESSVASEPGIALWLASACLLGCATRYDGGHCAFPALVEMAARGLVLPFCPEVAGGLPVPRPPAECCGGDGNGVLAGMARVRTAQGVDVTEAFLAGAERALSVVRRLGIRRAVLKESSPSCGVHWVHDGSFEGRLVSGCGVTTALLRRYGIDVCSEEEWLRVHGGSAGKR
ncbi:MAG: DUF523 domain-containing protein [Chloroflexia bacterium]